MFNCQGVVYLFLLYIGEKYCPELFRDFADTKDPKHQSYTKYTYKELLGTMFYKGIAGSERNGEKDEAKAASFTYRYYTWLTFE